MKLIYKIFRLDQESREGVVVATSILGILVNLVMASVKILIGMAASSIAVVSEGINNASDCATSLITIIGTKLSAKHPTNKHPFGYGRIEYFTSLIISVLILITGAELLKSSVELIVEPKKLSISYITLIVVAVSAVIKLLLGTYTLNKGKKIDSGSLIALGADCRNDSVVSAVTIAAALVFLFTGKNIDAFAGIFTSVFILKAGVEIILDTVGDLLGRSGDKKLADQIYAMVRKEPIVLNAADMMLHNYGPDAYSGSVNIEIDHSKTVGEIYACIHALQLKILHEYNISMVFGIYAVDKDHDLMKELRKKITGFIRGYGHIESYHALYIDEENGDIYCDLVVDYELEDWDQLRKDFTEFMKKEYPDRRLELVIETNYV